MNDLISQLFDIATNEEFSPDQRRFLMQIALDEAKQEPAPSLTLNIDETLGRALTKERTPHGIRFGLSTFSANE